MRPPQVISAFPSLIHCIEVDNFKKTQDELIDYAYKKENEDPIGVVKSNEEGWQSQTIHSTEPNPIFSVLSKELVKYFSNKDIFIETFQMKVGAYWININRNGSYNRLHTHPGSDLSGVFWIKTPKHGDSGSLQFISPYEFLDYKLMQICSPELKKSLTYYPASQFFPTPGTIMLFPARLMHEVRTNHTREDRISASFNINISSID